jgi:DNA (cytosine-5)-methyltransferase 1
VRPEVPAGAVEVVIEHRGHVCCLNFGKARPWSSNYSDFRDEGPASPRTLGSFAMDRSSTAPLSLFGSDSSVEPKPERNRTPKNVRAADHRARFRFIDLFAGIGGFRIALSAIGGKCVFTSEWDKHSQATYHAWFGERPHGDINDVDPIDIPDHDILAAGFPCQPFSLAGVSKKNALGQAHGFSCERQGNLFFRIRDIAAAKRPGILLLENVKNLRSHDAGKTWAVITSELDSLGYEVHSRIIDARAWVPQHRERIFLVCFDRKRYSNAVPFRFPNPPKRGPTLAAILEQRTDPKYVLSQHLWDYLRAYAEKHRKAGNGFGFGLVGPGDVARTLSARYHKDGSEILVKRGSGRPRRLTPQECARLMGYSDKVAKRFGFAQGFPIVVSDTQAYRQFGNSVVPAVVEAIAKQLAPMIRPMRRSAAHAELFA